MLVGVIASIAACKPNQGTADGNTDGKDTVAIPRPEFPREADRELANIQGVSKDDKKVSITITYHYKLKVEGDSRTYVEKTLDPICKNSVRKVIAGQNSEALTEDNWKEIRGLLFRAINENINPLEVSIDMVRIDALNMKK